MLFLLFLSFFQSILFGISWCFVIMISTSFSCLHTPLGQSPVNYIVMLSNIIRCKVFRRNKVSEYYFNVTVMRHGSERTTSFPFPASANGRHLITTRRSGWTILNTHAESGSLYVERDSGESQLLHMSRSHEFEEQGQLCFLAGDLILPCARCSDASTATPGRGAFGHIHLMRAPPLYSSAQHPMDS